MSDGAQCLGLEPRAPEHPLGGTENVGTAGAAANGARWSIGKQVMFRFASGYCFLAFVLPPLLGLIGLRDLYAGRLMSWVGTSWFGLSARRLPLGGCGDGANEYIAVVVNGALALVATGLWSVFDRHRPRYRGLAYWVTAGVRYYLAFHMLLYGFIKVLKSQFPFPEPSTLIRTFGESSPMDVMWAFMGYSTAYCMFIGAGEVLGGALLLFRRTTTAGALVTSGVMANVFFLNVAYDVCVKVMSAHLLAMALGLVAIDARRLFDALVLRRAVPASPVRPLAFSRRATWALLIGKGVLVSAMLALTLGVAWENWHVAGSPAPKSALYGLWAPEAPAAAESAPAEPAQSDPSRWLLLAIDSGAMGAARQADGTLQRFSLEIDSSNETLTLATFGKRQSTAKFRYEQPSPDEMVWISEASGQATRLRRRDLNELPLLRHRLQWVKDLPQSD